MFRNQIINTNPDIDFMKQPIFLGEDLNIQRYDTYKYPFYYNSYQKQIGSFWRPEEFNLTKDRNDFLNLTDIEQEIFSSNLKFQILLDSVQNRGIPYLSDFVSLPEVELSFKTWEFFELIHSYSYTYIIQNVYSNTNEVFDTVLKTGPIMDRAVSTTKDYNELLNIHRSDNIATVKDKIFRNLISINILEGLRFYVSFACSYAFAENKKVEGNAKIIAMINRDENLHLAITQKTIDYLRNEPEEGFVDVVKRNNQLATDMYASAAEEEIEWAKYLFRNGSILGLNDSLLIDYMKWLTNKRMKSIGLEPIYSGAKNPFPWITNWTDSGSIQVASQETENETYRISSVKNDLDGLDYTQF